LVNIKSDNPPLPFDTLVFWNDFIQRLKTLIEKYLNIR